MNIAIVGTSNRLTKNQVEDIKLKITEILKEYEPIKTTIITGGAKGVDKIAEETALVLGYAVKPIYPLGYGWDFNKPRNIQIAEECDKLYCITVPVHSTMCYHHDPHQKHEKTAGCWTQNKAKECGKPTQLIVIPYR